MFLFKKNTQTMKQQYNFKDNILIIDNINIKIYSIKLDDTEKIYILKKYTDIHIDLLDNNRKFIETSSIINGIINYTFFPENMENLIKQKYLYCKVSYENISEINELNNIYNINLEIIRDNKIICRGFLNSEILLYKNTNNFIIELYENKYLIDTKCLIKLVNVNLYNNKKKINSNNF